MIHFHESVVAWVSEMEAAIRDWRAADAAIDTDTTGEGWVRLWAIEARIRELAGRVR